MSIIPEGGQDFHLSHDFWVCWRTQRSMSSHCAPCESTSYPCTTYQRNCKHLLFHTKYFMFLPSQLLALFPCAKNPSAHVFPHLRHGPFYSFKQLFASSILVNTSLQIRTNLYNVSISDIYKSSHLIRSDFSLRTNPVGLPVFLCCLFN